MDIKATVLNTLNDETMFEGTLEECKQYIEKYDNGFLTIIP